ncbi:MAG: TIGR00266 family protein [Chloroflexi bacterium]|nr:TIGR00266 family protein [Chloroflexota bacterium]
MEYKIEGTPFPVVQCTLANNERMISESGAMAWMTPNILMETTSRGGLGKILGRMVSGESLFLNTYTSNGVGMIAFASSFPGSILTFDISPQNEVIVQKSGFLASEAGVELSMFFNRKFKTGLFGGEGFIMQRLSGHGKAFVEIDGYCKVFELRPGEKMLIDSGYLAAMETTCTMDVKTVTGGLKSMVFGGEGLFNTEVTGPGKVYLQTQPISTLAKALSPFFTKSSD